MASDTRKVSRSSQKTGRSRARRLLGPTVVLTALVVWVLVGWRELYPPVSIVSARAGQVADMVRCPGGTLWTQTPQRSYEIESFYLDRFEVTRAEYAEFLRAHPERTRPRNLELEAVGRVADPELPVTWVSWHDAQAYARWVGKRLPTSIEWEWAARGPRDLRYPWGSYGQEWVANTADLELGRPTPVGLFEDGRSTLGLYDMVGNVAEWTATAAGASIEDRFFVRGGSFRDFIFGANRTDFLAVYEYLEPEDDPKDLTPGRWLPSERFLRGPSYSSGELGFRCALDADPEFIWAQIARLGYRDPVGYLLQVRPATRKLEEIGEPSLPLLTQAAASLESGRVKQRLLDLIARIRGAGR